MFSPMFDIAKWMSIFMIRYFDISDTAARQEDIYGHQPPRLDYSSMTIARVPMLEAARFHFVREVQT